MENTFIAHHGIKGQKWGIRRYQNEDGSLTKEGESRYGDLVGSKKGIKAVLRGDKIRTGAGKTADQMTRKDRHNESGDYQLVKGAALGFGGIAASTALGRHIINRSTTSKGVMAGAALSLIGQTASVLVSNHYAKKAESIWASQAYDDVRGIAKELGKQKGNKGGTVFSPDYDNKKMRIGSVI